MGNITVPRMASREKEGECGKEAGERRETEETRRWLNAVRGSGS